MKEKFLNSLEELRKKAPKRNFTQSVDLIINLKDFDTRKDSLNTFAQLPFPPSEKRICAFIERPNKAFDFCITKLDFDKWNDKKEIKRLARDYDFFASIPQLMSLVATKFGRILGPLGKMPSPQLGLITSQDELSMQELAEKMRKIVRIKAKEPSVKIMIGKENMENEKIAQNAEIVYNAAVNALPRKKENIKSVMIKLTMSKPVKLDLK
jgi:large subunit ribosomal protein L1